MSEASRKKKLAYDLAFQKKKSQVRKRVELNKKNRELQKNGKAKVGDKKDVSHTKKGTLVLESQKTNRARNGTGKGGKRISTKK